MMNSYAIQGHFFNFSTSGQWLWDEVQVTVPATEDPYPDYRVDPTNGGQGNRGRHAGCGRRMEAGHQPIPRAYPSRPNRQSICVRRAREQKCMCVTLLAPTTVMPRVPACIRQSWSFCIAAECRRKPRKRCPQNRARASRRGSHADLLVLGIWISVVPGRTRGSLCDFRRLKVFADFSRPRLPSAWQSPRSPPM